MRFYIISSFLLWASFFNCLPVFAQTNNLNKDFVSAVAAFNATSKNDDFAKLLSRFEQIEKNNNSKDWVPAYYISIVYTRLSFNHKKEADAYADEAVVWAKKSISIQANDENYCALSMAQTAKMSVSPYLRWIKYEKRIYDPLYIAKKLNPNNPRVYILEASLKMNIPVLFGGGCENSKPMLLKAKQLMDKLAPDPILPSWGKQSLVELKEACPF
jgi:hypothetical protein